MTTGKDVVDLARTQIGAQYIINVITDDENRHPGAFDCSELIRWVCARLGITMPDKSWRQLQFCKDTQISTDAGIAMPGALLFRFTGDPWGDRRPPTGHVAISQGNRKTVEARNRKSGVAEFSALRRRWTHAALIPGVEYA